MVFQESETCELKVTVVDDIKKEMKPAGLEPGRQNSLYN